jgi:hypothetical protein
MSELSEFTLQYIYIYCFDFLYCNQLYCCVPVLKMENTLLTFQDQYSIYDGDQSLDEKGLTIGGYESVWLADLVAA